MQLSRTVMWNEIIHGREFPMDSIVLKADNGTVIVCCDFHHSRKEPLELFCFLPAEKKWIKTHAKNKYTELMWDYYRKCGRKHRVHYKKHVKKKNRKGATKPVEIPKSVLWSIKHPFQGGGISPR